MNYYAVEYEVGETPTVYRVVVEADSAEAAWFTVKSKHPGSHVRRIERVDAATTVQSQ